MAIKIPDRLFARYYDRMAAAYDKELTPRKQEFLADLEGVVVEIGPGTGCNLVHMPDGVEWIGIEPNEHMHPLLLEKARGLGLDVDLRLLSAGKLPLDDQSVDAVLSTLVLCSVPDTAQVLGEIHRVLKPGGCFYFWEHVIAPESRRLRFLQHAITPLQRFIADGCRANRDLATDIRAAAFSSVEVEEFSAPKGVAPAWIRPHVMGKAVR